MDNVVDVVSKMLASGWLSLLDYLAAHVLLCLLPAFVIAGFMSAMIPKETITRYLGPRASKWISYPAAAIGGFILAVCSCTILPLFAGIWRRGAGLGPAITFLFVGPAVNILAIAYTGAAIGMDIALARIVLSILFGILIGLIMAWLFRNEQQAAPDSDMFQSKARLNPATWALFGLLFAVLIVGTLQVEWLSTDWVEVSIPLTLPERFSSVLDAAHLDPRGATLIGMLVIIAPIAYLGFENVLSRFNRWTYLAIGLTAVTILLAAPSVSQGSLRLGLTGRFFGELVLVAAIGVVAARSYSQGEIAGWLWESWKFVKQIFPLLIVGIFAAGMVKAVLPEEWVRSLAGQNTLWANAIGVIFGVFMYFPTLVEVPIARMFLDLGMHRGPLLAYLLADPELSLQSILVTGRILGGKKTAVYILLVSIFSTLAGYLFGLVLAAL
jgi:uncharacterized membrane protein YraQ (UPF0718 family)